MSTLTIDIETTVKNAEGISEYVVGDDKASPYHPENEAVLFGFKRDEAPTEVHTDNSNQDVFFQVGLLVGQNLRFDLHYMAKYYDLMGWLRNPEHKVWDTQLAEYILTAQREKYASLDGMSLKYGLPLKDDEIKEHWAAGGQTEDIPLDKLSPYLVQDVENTYQIYLKQRELAEMSGMLDMIEMQMRFLVATWEMSRNGMCFDFWRAVEQADALQVEIDAAVAEIQPYVDSRFPEAPAGSFSITSNDVLSKMLFGGTYEYTVDVDTGEVFKSGKRKGQVKTRKETRSANTSNLFTPLSDWETKKSGVYQVGDGICQCLLAGKNVPEEARKLLEYVSKLRAMVKDRNTYFVGFSKLAWPQDGKHFIYGKLNHCATDTGRLSSSSPNLQNLSNKERD